MALIRRALRSVNRPARFDPIDPYQPVRITFGIHHPRRWN